VEPIGTRQTLNLNSNYYIPAEHCFQNLIQSIWQVEGSPFFQKEHIIPKGVVEAIFNFSNSDPIPSRLGDKQYHLSKCFINGFNTAPIQTQLPEQQVFLGVVFQPLAVKKIFRTPACEFSDITVDLNLIDSSFNTLWHQMVEQNNFNIRVNMILGWLKKHFIDWQPREQMINNFLFAIDQHDLSVTELANSLCYSPRHLTRKLFEATGMNTEEILLYKKYLHAVDLIHDARLSLTEIAYQSHFSDQSHFIKTFKSYTDLTPGEYKRNMSSLKGHIYEKSPLNTIQQGRI
jgi:AraC-like DNA-binding protein